MQEAKTDIRLMTKQRGDKMSRYGEEILQVILNSKEHPTAEQIFMEMKKRNSKIVQATVYNNLKSLTDSGRIIRISQAGFPDRYDNTSRHDHMICRFCGAITDIFCLDDMTEAIENQLGEKIESYDLRISHVCNECKKQKR